MTLLKQAVLHDPLTGAVCNTEEIWQMVDERYRAWHVGCLNSRSIGHEHEGYAGSASHPVSLYNASALLSRNICDRRGILKQHRTCAPGILGHNDANNCHCGGDHWDPGGGWDWTYYINAINGTTWQNPPYLFDGGINGWTPGNGTSALWSIGPPGTNCVRAKFSTIIPNNVGMTSSSRLKI